MRDYPSHQSTKPIMITFDHFTEIYRPMKPALSNRPPPPFRFTNKFDS